MRYVKSIVFVIVAFSLLSQFAFAGRYYDPEIGRFTTPDPALQKHSPQEIAAMGQGQLLHTSPYVYANNNPLRYVDPDGNMPWDALDVVSLGLSINDFRKDPSWANAGWVAADVAGLLPLLPSAGLVRHGSKLISRADLMRMNAKAGNRAENIVAEGLDAAGISYKRGIGRGGDSVFDFVTETGQVIEVKNINWSSKTYQSAGGVTGRITQLSKQLEKYGARLNEGEQLVLKITKPNDPEVLKQLNQMSQDVGAKIEWLNVGE